MSNPKVSVVMSVYNEKPEHLKLSIESILHQSMGDFEFIVILDNPKNKILDKIIAKYCKIDNRIRYFINEKNLGLAYSLNRAVSYAQSDIIVRMDADDIAISCRIEKQLNFIATHSEYRVVTSNRLFIDIQNNIIQSNYTIPRTDKALIKLMKYENIIVHPTAMFFKSDFYAIGQYRGFPASQDYDLWLRYISEGKRIGIMKEKLLMYRVGGNNTSNVRKLSQWYCHRYIVNLFRERLRKGTDSYTDDKIDAIITAERCDNIYDMKKFNDGYNSIREAKEDFSNKKYFLACTKFLRGIFSHRAILQVLLNSLAYRKTLRKLYKDGDIILC